MTGRLIELETGRGPYHMAADDRMLAWAVAGVPSLRFYTWDRATLSLGYFQAYADRPESVKSLPVVRRATGGGAIVHHHELTYSIGIPAALAGTSNNLPWGCRMHYLIADVLKAMTVTADTVVCGEEKKTDPFLCFHHHTAGDLAMGLRTLTRDKIIGSAQRKQQGAILQHGSILLAKSEFAPTLPGIRELSGQILSPLELSKKITQTFMDTMKWPLAKYDWTPDDKPAIEQDMANRYGHDDWTQKR